MKIRIRAKLAAALAVPLLALVALAGFEAVQAAGEADRVRDEAELAIVSIGPGSLTTELQNERNYTALELIGLADAATLEVSSVAEARARVDTAVEEFEAFLAGRDPIVREAFAPAFAAFEDIDDTRRLWDEHEGDKDLENQELADEVFSRFTEMTNAFFQATGTVAAAVDDARLRNGIEIVDESNRRAELLATVTRGIVLDSLTEGNEARFQADAAVGVDRILTHERRVAQLSVGPYGSVADETLRRDFDVETHRYFSSYLLGEDVDLTGLLAAVSAGSTDEVTSPAEMASEILGRQASVMTSGADETKRQFALLAVGVVALAVLASWLASRSITRPLRALRNEADEMASRRLPGAVQQILETPLGDDVVVPELEPIEVKTRDEVREVVAVLNGVLDRTLALAADQAVLRRNIADSFVNLGRRNQNLLDRQLEFITELEQGETEPEQLEALFRLDHLATRMRRNAESLLVLAGVESPRQWSAPVSIDDVLRASLGEVEDYQRVHVRNVDPALVSGTAASSISHVVAELVENALNFSPPDEVVEVKGRSNHDGYVIAVDDNGIGMSAEDVERANRRLCGDESYTVAPSRYLGHYVAGNLAERLGITVRVQDSPAGGVTATVTVPAALLADADDAYVPAHLAGVESTAVAPPEEAAMDDPVDDPDSIESWVHGHRAEPVEPIEPAESIDPVEVPVGPDTAAEPAPATLDEALGVSELESIHSVEDFTRATEGGLPKRVPGAQRPDGQPTIARRNPKAPEAAEPQAEDAVAAQDQPTPARGAPGGAFRFLAAFSDAGARDDDHTEDR